MTEKMNESRHEISEQTRNGQSIHKSEECEHVERQTTQVKRQGVALVPQPSDNPRDPLNWPSTKKCITLAIACLASFAGMIQALANSSGFFFQADLYHKTPVEISYSISAAIAGLAVGPLIWTPLARHLGKCGCIFWSMVLTICMNIWSARLTDSNDYIPFVDSRLLAGFFGSAASVMGAKSITEAFFLHDRGKCFAIYSCSILLGTVASGTFSGFIVEEAHWPVQFWYNVALEGLVGILCLTFLQDTGWTRPDGPKYPPKPAGRMREVMATYLFTQRVTPRETISETARFAVLPFLIGLSPVTILIGLALFVFFSWSVAVNTFVSIFLQEPLQVGGYAFSPKRNAAFSFTGWVGVFAAQAYGYLFNDCLPLAICARNGGQWHPEYRLHVLWVPVLVVYPIGLGLFGAALFYHLHYMALAFAVFLISFSAVTGVPACVNYIIEAFTPAYANEATAILNLYRLVFGIALTFFMFPWVDAVGINWCFGMMAFFTILVFLLILMTIRFGAKLRKYNLVHSQAEERVLMAKAGASEEA